MTTSAFSAVRCGDLTQLQQALGTTDINQQDSSGLSLLHQAISSRNDDAALLLLGKGIDVEIQDKQGRSALHYAATFQNRRLVEALLDAGANLEGRDAHGNSALWAAIQSSRKDYDLVELFIAKGANPVQKNNAGRSPRDFASQTGNQALVAILDKGTSQ